MKRYLLSLIVISVVSPLAQAQSKSKVEQREQTIGETILTVGQCYEISRRQRFADVAGTIDAFDVVKRKAVRAYLVQVKDGGEEIVPNSLTSYYKDETQRITTSELDYAKTRDACNSMRSSYVQRATVKN